MNGPVVAVSCGDPSGIGPEITVKAVKALGNELTAVWLGDPAHLVAGTDSNIVDSVAKAVPGRLNVLSVPFGATPVVPGRPEACHAEGTIEAVRLGVDLVQTGQADALCTAPITKRVLKEGAGFGFPGHTEFLAHLAGVERVVMMLASDDLRVVPVTIHVPLSSVPELLKTDDIVETVRITAKGLRDRFGIPSPRIAVTGLNPHAGEGGLMGTEDGDVIAPALARLSSEGYQVSGPHPADTLFHAAARKRYDVAIAMYHDQALIPIKTLAFDEGVNVTLGLPFLRTSPDHGTAHDIAGQGIANPASMIAALRLAAAAAKA